MKFKLKEESVVVRGETFVVKELTHAERLQWVKTVQEDRFQGPAFLISLGVVSPKTTADEAGEFPHEVVEALVAKIMDLSGMSKKEGAKEKEPVAG